MQAKLKCAVIGARGIGKQHAKWYHLEGCDVVAFAGTSPESVAEAKETLLQLFPFKGNAYTDYVQMLEREKPDIVSICSPYPLHEEHAIAALQSGANVLCEKPLTWEKGRAPEGILQSARKMVQAAQEARKALSLNTQYVAVVPLYEQLYEDAIGKLIKRNKLFVRMESGGGDGGREYEDIPIDLAPHAISLLLKWVPGGDLDPDTIHCEIGRKETVIRFDYLHMSNERCAVEFVFVNKKEKPFSRRFGLNDMIVDYEGRKDTDGIFKAFLSFEGKEHKSEDFMRLCIRQFIHAVQTSGETLVTAEEAYRNTELQVSLLEKGVRV